MRILSKTPDWIAVDKPAGVHGHPLRENETGTVLQEIVSCFSECAQAGRSDKPIEGLLVHRLDRGTSGVLVCARNLAAFERLREAWKEKNVIKIYLAWVDGNLEKAGHLSCFLSHAPKSKKRMLVSSRASKNSWPAMTSIFPIHRAKDRSLVLIQIHTGVMHQIRATMAALGHPVLGDPIYRAAKKPPAFSWKPLAARQKSLFRELAAKSGSAKQSAPDAALLPVHAFFLHALYLKIGGDLAIFASPPEYF